MKSKILKMLSMMTLGEKRRVALLACLAFVLAIFETAGVASIMPFIAVLASPEIINNSDVLNYLFNFFNFTSQREFLFFLGVLSFCALIFSLSLKVITSYSITRFTLLEEYRIATRLSKNYIHKPYSWHLENHSSGLAKNALSEVNNVVNGVLLNSLNLVVNSTLAILLVALLLLVHPTLAILTTSVLSLLFLISYHSLAPILDRLGARRTQANTLKFASLTETFGAVKEIKATGTEKEFLKKFEASSISFARAQSNAAALLIVPRYFIEAVAFGGALLATVTLLLDHEQHFGVEILAVYAFAGYKLLPALQAIYFSVAQIKYHLPALDVITLDNAGDMPEAEEKKQITPVNRFDGNLEFKNVSFRYNTAAAITISDINFNIPAGQNVAFVGQSGSGKTTLVDMILGLLSPTSGKILSCNKPIAEITGPCYQIGIGYVSQNIFLLNDTIASNIAFGIAAEDIVQERLEAAALNADIHRFITRELPNQYQTVIGENGTRLSGGQKQRIGIARAIYNNPELLILDEATSALDSLTERRVLTKICAHRKGKTTIVITHRLSTIESFDYIFLLEDGTLADSGTYDELFDRSKIFRALALANSKDEF